jgi:hypothetical protein
MPIKITKTGNWTWYQFGRDWPPANKFIKKWGGWLLTGKEKYVDMNAYNKDWQNEYNTAFRKIQQQHSAHKGDRIAPMMVVHVGPKKKSFWRR